MAARTTTTRARTDGDRGTEEQAILDGIRRIVRALRESSRAAEAHYGLTGAQLFVLQTLSRSERPLSLNELAEKTRTHQSSVSVVVSRLVEKGLVLRTRAAEDARRLEIALTDEAEGLLRDAPGAAQERLLRGVKQLPDLQRRQLSRAITGLAVAMEAEAGPPAMFFEEEERSDDT